MSYKLHTIKSKIDSIDVLSKSIPHRQYFSTADKAIHSRSQIKSIGDE